MRHRLGAVGLVADIDAEATGDPPQLSAETKKRAQVVLSAALGRALAIELRTRVPEMRAVPGEVNVAGALRVVKADVSEMHLLDGLRLAVELKPVNLAVGRAIWNRFGDIRTFAVNIHLKFPFAVVGGVLVLAHAYTMMYKREVWSMLLSSATGGEGASDQPICHRALTS